MVSLKTKQINSQTLPSLFCFLCILFRPEMLHVLLLHDRLRKTPFFSRFLRRYLVWYVGIVTGVGFCCCLFFVQLEQPMFVSIMSSSTWISTDLPTAWRTHAFWIQESQALCGARVRTSCTQTHTYEEATSMPMLLLSLLFPDELMAMLQSS